MPESLAASNDAPTEAPPDVPKRRPPPRSAGRPSGGRRARFLAMLILVVVGVQAPLLWALARLTGHGGLFVAGAALLTGAVLSGFFAGHSALGDPGKGRLYFVMWPFFVSWTLSLVFAFLSPVALVAAAVFGGAPNAALAAALAVAALVTATAFVHRVRVRDREVPIVGLPAAFDGYRIVQLSDLHCGPFVSGRRVARWVARANRLSPDLVAVTGDLISSGPAFVSTVARELGALAAPDGVFASMGNHDYFVEGELMVDALVAAGLSVLRNRGVALERDGATLWLAGVDDTWTGRHDVGKALEARPAGAPTVLLAHDPALFPEAVEAGVELTLSGHTHGGQLGFPFAARKWNLARVMTTFTSGLYQSGRSTLYVNNGLGTTGVPIRLLVPPEIAVLTLRCA